MASPPKTDAPHAAGHQASVGVADGHGAAVGFPPFDKATFAPQLFWLALTFAFLYFMLSKRLLPQVGNVIEKRADGIRGDLEEADRLKSDTEQSLKDYETALTAAKANASGIAKTQRDALAAETDREKAAVDAKMAAKVADAEKRINASKVTALSAVSDVAGETVGAIVAKLTGQSVTTAEVAAAISAVKAK
jgi:F-type H+-transporting ATPase subunit b